MNQKYKEDLNLRAKSPGGVLDSGVGSPVAATYPVLTVN